MILLILFLPISVYLIWVGSINRQSRPVFVEGVWDFVALMFASSGLVLFGVPAVITSLNETWRRYWLTGEGPLPFATLEGSRVFWVFLWGLYLVLVIAVFWILLSRRKNWYCVYNVDLDQLDVAATRALETTGFQVRRIGHFFLLKDPNSMLEETVELDLFRPLSHASLYFSNPNGIACRQVILSLGENLSGSPAPEHWAGLALIFAGSFLLFLTIISQLMFALVLH